MRLTKRVFLLSLTFGLLALPVMASNVNVVFYDNRYGTVNDSTGAYSQIGTLPIGAAGGIAELNGLLYLEDFGNNLYSVDTVTGNAALMGNTTMNLSMAVFGGSQLGLFELDFASDLYAINPTSGAAALVGHTGLAANNGYYDTSMSADGTSLLYTAGRVNENEELYRINVSTGIATDLGNTGVTSIAGSAFVDGKLELYQYGQSTNYIYSAPGGSPAFTRGPQLGAQIIDGGVQLGSFDAMSQNQVGAVPEPSTAWLFGTGVLLLFLGCSRVNRGRRMVMAPVKPVVSN